MLIMIDGIDGSGKSSVVAAWKEYLTGQGNIIFDLKEYQKKNNRYPDYNEIKSCDFVFSHEPSSAGIGKTIREEFIKNNTDYPAYAIAEAYALDRLILYKKIIVPALKDGKFVISDRAVCTSICYQNILDPKNLTFDVIAKIPGNAFTLEYPPEHLILMDIEPQIALQRLGSRIDKNDNAIFEKLNFLKKAAEIYQSEKYRDFFKKLGTKVHYFPGSDAIDTMQNKGIELLKELLSKNPV